MKVLRGLSTLILLGAVACASSTERRSDAEVQGYLARAATAATVTDRWRLGVDARLKAGLGFGYFAAIRENGASAAEVAGSRALEPVVKFAKSDLLEIGSVSKTFTGILLHLAALEGKIDLDGKLADFFPELKGSEAGEIAFRELGTQRSGLPREAKSASASAAKADELIAALKNERRAPIPEGKTERAAVDSDLGYAVLGLALERAYGRPYKELVEKKVLFPLGMRESGVDRKTKKRRKGAPKAVAGYALDASPLPLRDSEGFTAAAGGIESNATDLAKFLTTLETPPAGKLGEAIAAAMKSGIGWDSGKGWREDLPTGVVWKTGATIAHSAVLVFDPEKKRAIFVGSNSPAAPDELGFYAVGAKPIDGLLAMTFPKRVPAPEELVRLKGTFLPKGPVPTDRPPLRRVDVSEILGHFVARFGYDGRTGTALLVPEEKEDLWSAVDGAENLEKIRLTDEGMDAGSAELKKIAVEPEKYPAIEK